MMWQDAVISAGSFIFGLVMIPQLVDCIKGETSLNLYSAFLSASWLFVFAFTFFTLDLYLSAVMDIFTGVVWSLIFAFSWRNETHVKVKMEFSTRYD